MSGSALPRLLEGLGERELVLTPDFERAPSSDMKPTAIKGLTERHFSADNKISGANIATCQSFCSSHHIHIF